VVWCEVFPKWTDWSHRGSERGLGDRV
jgi:hypothetical protein